MKRIIVAAIIVLFLGAAALPGQTKTGTTIGQFLLIDPSARTAAMGGAGTASAAEAFALYYNPGAIAAIGCSDVQFTTNSWYAGIAVVNATAVLNLGGMGAAAFSLTHLGSGEIDVRTVQQPLGTGEKFTVSDLALGLGYGLRVTDRFTCGVQINYIQETIWHTSTSTFGINLGTLYQLSPNGLRIGASLSNFGLRSKFSGSDLYIRYDLDPTRYGDNSSLPSELSTDEFALPIVFRVGLSYPIAIGSEHTVTIAADALHPSDNSESMNLGAEYVFLDLLAVRAGYQGLFQTDSETGWTAGAGLLIEAVGSDIHFDYGWASHKRLGSVQRITIGFGF